MVESTESKLVGGLQTALSNQQAKEELEAFKLPALEKTYLFLFL